jgi:hypothetical protein
VARRDWLCTGKTADGRPCNAVLAVVVSPRDLRLTDAAAAVHRDRVLGGWRVVCARCRHGKRWPHKVCG